MLTLSDILAIVGITVNRTHPCGNCKTQMYSNGYGLCQACLDTFNSNDYQEFLKRLK